MAIEATPDNPREETTCVEISKATWLVPVAGAVPQCYMFKCALTQGSPCFSCPNGQTGSTAA